MNKEISTIGTSWGDFEKNIFTPKEIAESNLRVDIINEIIQYQENTSQADNKTVKGS